MVTPTPAQIRIRDHEGPCLLVVAPAGCGKTEALALRVAGLIGRGTIAASQRVLVATFSNRARDNIRDRLQDYLTPSALRNRVTVSNFHGLSARIFRAHADVIGLDPDMLIPENDWVADQCRSRRLSFNRSSAVQDTLQRAKQQAADDTAVEQIVLRSGDRDALEIEQLRRAENRLTYDDLPRMAELILANDRVAHLYQSHFAAVVVDEYQDLTRQQLRIVNRIGFGKATYAGDIAQGIYGFAGADPVYVDHQVRAECSTVIDFAESHRSSPAVLNMVNALIGLTGGVRLSSSDPSSWPGGGLAATISFDDTDGEVAWVVGFSRYVLSQAPGQRVGIIGRTAGRRRFVDAAFENSDVPFHRWDDGVLDTETAKSIKSLLVRLDMADYQTADDPLLYLRRGANFDGVQDPSTREALANALAWCCDLLQEGRSPTEIRSRIRVGDATTLLNVPGVHLLTGHIGKGQQFDWVIIIGAEDGCIPDFRATTHEALAEEARILSVMISRARHGVIIMCAATVQAQTGSVFRKQPSRFATELQTASPFDSVRAVAWLKSADWVEINKR